eukprot:c4555_g1_i1.p1 GENE.c4555_g1_i1~~c4555_g1_i1.p1  ORF type:complete len:361 (+),score=106.58 c4555_g1_i1:43-1083(+)
MGLLRVWNLVVCVLIVFVIALHQASGAASKSVKDMTISEIRKELKKLGSVCDGCVEKQDFVEMLEQAREQNPKNKKTTSSTSQNDEKEKKSNKKNTKDSKEKHRNKNEKSESVSKKSNNKTSKQQTVAASGLSNATLGPVECVIVANGLIYLLWQYEKPRRKIISFLLPSRENIFQNFRLWTPFTSTLIHANVMHLLHSSLMLLSWGLPLTDTIGKDTFVIVYFLGGLFGNILCVIYKVLKNIYKRYAVVAVATEPHNTLPPVGVWVGVWEWPSGSAAAVMSMMTVFALTFPDARVSWNGIPMSPTQLVLVHAAVDSLLTSAVNESGIVRLFGGLLAGVVVKLIVL